MNMIDTKIDERCRSGSLAGVCQPGEKYTVERVSPVEVRMHLLVPAEMPKPKLLKRGLRMVLCGGPKLTSVEVNKALEEFP